MVAKEFSFFGFVIWVFLGILGCSGSDIQGDRYERVEQMRGPVYDNNRVGGLPNPSKPPKDGWQSSGALLVGRTDRAVSLQANFPESDTYTVQFAILKAPPGNTFKCKAEISWAVEGGQVKRTVDVGNGVSVSGVAQGATVRIFDNSNATDYAAFVGQEYIVSAQIAKGSRASTDQPPTVFETGDLSINPGANSIITIPHEIGVISVNVEVAPSNTTPVNYPYRTIVNMNNTVESFKSYDPVVEPGFVPIPPGATRLQIFNINTDPLDVAVYSVTWGIDG